MGLKELIDRQKLKAAKRALYRLEAELNRTNEEAGIRPKAVELLTRFPRVERAANILSEMEISELPPEEGARLVGNRMREEVPNLTDAEVAAVCQLKVDHFKQMLEEKQKANHG